MERGGRVRARVVPDVTGKTLKAAIRETVHPSSRIVTDEYGAYNRIGEHFDGGHETVHHKSGEYVRGDVYTNTAESYFALLKRGVTGSFHSVSRRHLDRYCTEFSFRWNYRMVSDSERTSAAIRGADGKRLTYKPLVG